MRLDLTDWAALLEALDGLKAIPPAVPPLPMDWRVGLVAAKGRRKLRPRRGHGHGVNFGMMPLSQ